MAEGDSIRRIPAERKKCIYEYDVTGDVSEAGYLLLMLWHDAAWPRSEENLTALLNGKTKIVQLRSLKYPEIARWKSYGWGVL